MIAAPAAAPAIGMLSGSVMCAVSLVASSGPLRLEMPKFPNIKMPGMPKLPGMPSLPKMPDMPNLPGQGKTEAQANARQTPKVTARASAGPVSASVPTGVKPRVRAASGKVKTPLGSENAPSLAELRGGNPAGVTLASGSGWKRFPVRRMPGASLDGWKKIASEIRPGS